MSDQEETSDPGFVEEEVDEEQPESKVQEEVDGEQPPQEEAEENKRKREESVNGEAAAEDEGADEAGQAPRIAKKPKTEADDSETSAQGKAAAAGEGSSYTHAVRLRGLPWASKVEDVKRFFGDISLADEAIFVMHNKSGEGYVRLKTEEDQRAALRKDRECIGRRYVEVFQCGVEEAEEAKRLLGRAGITDEGMDYKGVIRMRGLPWSASERDIINFFSGLQLKSGGVHMVTNREGRASGDAYAVFETAEEAQKALAKDKEKIGNRWIDLFESTMGEMMTCTGQGMGPGGSGGMRGGMQRQDDAATIMGLTPAEAMSEVVLKMRGLPFEATKADVEGFFEGLGVEANHIFLITRPDGKASGEAYTVFSTVELAREGLKKDKEKLHERWIDLFPTNRIALYQAAGAAVLMASKPDAKFSGVVRMRGLPFSATVSGVLDFFTGYRISDHGVYIISGQDGRPSGDAYVVFVSEDEARRSLELNKKEMGERWIELFQVTKSELYSATTRSRISRMDSGKPMFSGAPFRCVRLRGLPYNTSEDDLSRFFRGLQIVRVTICRDGMQRPSGSGFVEFKTMEDCQLAMSRNKQMLGTRENAWIEVSPCSKDDLLREVEGGGRWGDWGGDSGGGGWDRGSGRGWDRGGGGWDRGGGGWGGDSRGGWDRGGGGYQQDNHRGGGGGYGSQGGGYYQQGNGGGGG
ncbi:unnamed protein product, partial [Chrysoparadoxa australica]